MGLLDIGNAFTMKNLLGQRCMAFGRHFTAAFTTGDK
jgi:hypothetical protein